MAFFYVLRISISHFKSFIFNIEYHQNVDQNKGKLARIEFDIEMPIFPTHEMIASKQEFSLQEFHWQDEVSEDDSFEIHCIYFVFACPDTTHLKQKLNHKIINSIKTQI